MGVFAFHWGCTRLGALGDDQRGQTVCAHGGTEPLLPPLDIFFRHIPSRLVPGTGRFVPGRYKTRFVPLVMKSSRDTGN